MAAVKAILILSPFFPPNIGGVETHLADLCLELARKNYKVYVHTYSPLTTSVKYQKYEKSKNLTIYRYPWLGKNLFHRLEKYPLLDFLYLTPYLFLRTFFWMLLNSHKINIIHSQGFNAAFAGYCLSLIFHKKHLISTHAVYDNISTSTPLRFILNHSDHVLCLSHASQKQLIQWGIDPKVIDIYKYWINLKIFQPSSPKSKKFSVLFVGRLIEKKGIKVIVAAAQKLPQIQFNFIGTGPLSDYLSSIKQKNIKFIGKISNINTPKYYSQNHIFCAPSLYEEGYGRVAMEAVACGTPVIASNRGGLPEALDNSVAILIKPTPTNLVKAIKKIRKKYSVYQKNCRPYALKNYSNKNLTLITRFYK
ncbi:MAG TPA: glycosyltransferase family 4 protein [Candidatus Woesebacteria bacterium]|nr:glycosyltransferase family 4 protein [Candidatus Woesebacteria bacterium]